MPRKKSHRQFPKFSLRNFLLLLLGFCLPFLIYVIYLDRQVVRQFEGKRFSLPAKVFARPLELYPGKKIHNTQLQQELVLLNYTKVSQVGQPGQYSLNGAELTLFTRPFTLWDGKQNAAHLILTFNQDRITSLIDVETQKRQHLARLEPVAIGGIYPNQGEDRELVRLSQIPDTLIHSLIATEDKRFYQHNGIDPKSILRAISTLFTGGRIQGGSTITQQLVKNFYLTQERTLQRKIKEMIMALLLELHYGKADILETYINEVYFGQDKNRAIHGFGLASQFYFSRPIELLEVDQAALLVGLLKGPVYYNPRRHPKRAKIRRNIVLNALADQGYINKETLQENLNKEIAVSALPNKGQSLYPAFMDLVIRQLKRDYREEDLRSEGLRIFTTLDPFEQKIAEKTLRSRIHILERGQEFSEGHLQGAIVLVNIHDGEVQAVVGGREANFEGFNRALDASRQIGSLIKPAIYLTALTRFDQFNLTSALDDSPFTWSEPGIEDWQPENYDKKFHGMVPLWLALAKSYNVAAARLGTEIGIDKIITMVRRLGVDKDLPNYASGLLGTIHMTPYEVAQMYHTIASGGFRTPFRAIREVTTIKGEPLKRYDLNIEPVISATPNFLITHGLQQVIKKGTGVELKRYLTSDLDIAGKTGTTDNLRDSWFAGFTGDKVAVVWLGNDNNKSINLTGASGAMTIWGEMMAQLSPSSINLPKPDNIKYVAINNTSGLLAVNNCSDTFELPFARDSLPEDSNYCSGKADSKIKSWLKKIFGKK